MSKKLKIALGADHAGYELKEFLRDLLKEKKYEVKDFGPQSDDRCDYPDFAHPVADAVERGEFDFGIITCGSGNGINMTANKHQGIRSALAWNEEVARLARQHNNANILALPSRFIDNPEAAKIVDGFLDAEFEGGRHANRVNKISLKEE